MTRTRQRRARAAARTYARPALGGSRALLFLHLNRDLARCVGALLGILVARATVSIGDLFNREIVELEPVQSIMTTEVTTVRASTHVSELVPLTDRGYRHLPVVDDAGRLVGMVTRGELIAVLNRALLGEGLSGRQGGR